MAYNQALVVAGGLAHIPIIILMFNFIDKKYNKRLNTEV